MLLLLTPGEIICNWMGILLRIRGIDLIQTIIISRHESIPNLKVTEAEHDRGGTDIRLKQLGKPHCSPHTQDKCQTSLNPSLQCVARPWYYEQSIRDASLVLDPTE
jgi:hypothetical protein